MPRRKVLYALCAALAVAAAGVTAAAQTANVTRTIVSRIDYPGDRYVTILATAEIAGGATVAMHTHPGVENSYVLAGEGEFMMQGKPDRHVAAGDAFQIPPGVPHGVRNGPAPMRLVTTYVVEKDKPLATPAPK